MSKILSRTEAAARIGCSTHTLARWEKQPNNSFPKPLAWASTRKFYSEAEIIEWLNERLRTKPARKRAEVAAEAST